MPVSTRVLIARILAVSGLVLLAGGLILGLLPKTVPGAFGSVSCGSAFHGNSDAAVTDFQDTLGGGLTAPLGSAEAACAAKRSDAKTVPVVLLVLGGAAVLGGVAAAASGSAKPERQPA
jgi:hypothetical protein